MRATIHNKRITRTQKHNDRNFDLSKAKNIDQERIQDNIYIDFSNNQVQVDDNRTYTFQESEAMFYQTHFKQAIVEQNERHKKSRHTERIKDVNETLNNMLINHKTCPEETIYQIGSIKDGTIEMSKLRDIMAEQLVWEMKTFPQCKILNLAGHADEQTPHIHIRKVWIGHDKNGNEIVSETKALKEMGIKPLKDKTQNKWNTAKMTYSVMCREHFIDICKAHGLDINTEPKYPGKKSQELYEFQAHEDKAKIKALEAQLEALTNSIDNKQYEANEWELEVQTQQHFAEEAQAELLELQKQINQAQSQLNILKAKNIKMMETDLNNPAYDYLVETNQQHKLIEHLEKKIEAQAQAEIKQNKKINISTDISR